MQQKIAEGFKLKNNHHPFIFENADGHRVRIMIVSSDVIRVQYLTPQDEKTSQDTLDHLPQRVNIKSDEQSMEIATSAVRLVVTLQPSFHLAWFNLGDLTPFAQDLPYRSYAYDESGNKWHYQRKFTENLYYGLGERSGSLDLTGRRFRLDRLDCMGYDAEKSDPLYKFCPFYISLSTRSKQAYGIYYNNFSGSTIDLGQENDAMWGPYTYYQSEAGVLDYYMIHGPSVSSIVHSYSLVTSRPRHLPPRYSLGYLASAMAYAEAEDAQTQIKDFASKCQSYDIPCDGIHLSSGYTMNEKGDRCVFTWNKTRFPDPVKLAKELSAMGMRIFANVKPWLLEDSHPHYKSLADKKAFFWNQDEPGKVMQWRGDMHTMGQASYIDFTSQSGYAYWKSHVKSQLLDKGYIPWLDNNEFSLTDDSHTFACEVPPDQYSTLVDSNVPFLSGPVIPNVQSSAKQVGTPLQTLLMIQASYEAIIEHSPNQRPFLISRSATPYSNELVSQTWSGDNTTAWKTIKYNIPMGLGAGLCSMPAGYGHDIGGFAGPKPDPEMFVRWVQQGVFWPRFSIHSWNTDGSITEPWMFPDVLPTIRAALQFRYRIIPFIYTLYVSLVYIKGEPLIRPVFYDHQHDTNTYTQGFEFMMGPSILVAPIYEPNQTTRKVYLPSETAWYHYQTGKYFKSQGEYVEVPSSLTEDAAAPFFVRAGSMMCFGKVMRHVHASPDDERRVQIFPEQGISKRKTFVLYEDDGDTLYHETGAAFAEIHVWMETTDTEILVGMDIVNDGFFPYYDTVWVTCPIKGETRKLIFDGQDDEEGQLVDSSNMRKLPRIVDDDTLNVYTGLKLNFGKAKKITSSLK